MSAELVSDEEMDFWSKAALVNISILFVCLFTIKNQNQKHTAIKLCQWPDLVQRSRQPFQTAGATEHNTASST